MFLFNALIGFLGFMPTALASNNSTMQSGALGILPFVMVISVFYLLILRPQTKRTKEQKALIASLQVGDEIITDCSIIGKITKIDREHELIQLEIQSGVSMRMTLDAVYAKVNQAEVKNANKNKTEEIAK